MRALFASCVIFAFSFPAMALRGGSGGGGVAASVGSGTVAIGLLGGIVNSSQNDLNTLQSRANVRAGSGPISTSQLNQGYEGAVELVYRFSGTIYALTFRPSYFYERADGSGTDGGYTYGVTGWTFFPMLRLYPMENDVMKFYMQFGLGYGQAKGFVGEGTSDVSFGSGSFGTSVGLGAEFCMTSSSCFVFEGNYRYLDFNRNIVTDSRGTFASGSLSQYAQGQEAELDGSDIGIKMSGMVLLAGYHFWF